MAVAAAAFAGCTMVGDNITGVDASRGRPTTCVKLCNDSYALLYDQEQKRHNAAVEACQALAQPDRSACLEAEDATHLQNMNTLSDGKTDCQNNCHRQGSGSAG